MSARYDVLIRNTTIVDGTGKASYRGSVAVSGGRIAAVGAVEGSAALEIDGAGLTTCPGFVDAHSHADLSILQVPGAENLLMQGITTFVGGNCGISLAPIRDDSYFAATLKAWNLNLRASWASFAEFLQEVESAGLAPNYLPAGGPQRHPRRGHGHGLPAPLPPGGARGDEGAAAGMPGSRLLRPVRRLRRRHPRALRAACPSSSSWPGW